MNPTTEEINVAGGTSEHPSEILRLQSIIAEYERRFGAQEALVAEREKEIEERTRALLDALYDAKKYLLILEQADLVVILLDGASRRFVYLNKRSEDIFGRTRDAVLRKETLEVYKLVPLVGTGPLFGDEFRKRIDADKAYRGDFGYTRADGEQGAVRLTVSKFAEEGGAVIFVVLGEDITQERERERLERQRIEETERLNQLMIGRELRMIALKVEMSRLSDRLNR